jgi:hypothetical protein
MASEERERPAVDNDLIERLALNMFRMTGTDFLTITYMISAEATKAAIGAKERNATDEEIVAAVTDAVNEWMNVQKDFILGFDRAGRKAGGAGR